MKYLHLFPNGIFTEPYIEFVNKNFNSNEHLFLVIGKGIDAKITPRTNVKKISKDFKSVLRLIKEMYRCEKIYLHGLFFKQIVLMLFMQPWLLKKSNWIEWGGDLYWYKYRKKSFISNLYEAVRRVVIKNMGEITTLVKGDYQLAKKWYDVKGKYYHGIYINPIKLEYLNNIKGLESAKKETINIQIGNSADPSNNHLEVLDLLKKYKDGKINIFIPLSYGNREYALEVVEYGKGIFGDKFKPLLNFLEPEEYSQYLASIDIAIFNHERQQALGNIFALLYLGKKVYIRNDVSTWDYLKNQLGLDLSNYLEINKLTYSEFISFKSDKLNKEKVEMIFDQNYIKKVWEKIFLIQDIR
jgi:dTDP-N-acetylfucosamine:lipid II N-acetylfucosaminyltransferase